MNNISVLIGRFEHEKHVTLSNIAAEITETDAAAAADDDDNEMWRDTSMNLCSSVQLRRASVEM